MLLFLSFCDYTLFLVFGPIGNTRTNFVASSKHFEKIIASPFKQLSALFIGLNESSQSELSNRVFFFFKFEIFQKLSWKN